MNIRPLHDHIFFVFEEETMIRDGHQMFRLKTDSNLLLQPDYEDSINAPRTGVVLLCGNDMKDPDIYPGKRILIAPLMWTNALKFEDMRCWRTEPKHVLAVFDDEEK
jgi:hypothetical protein